MTAVLIITLICLSSVFAGYIAFKGGSTRTADDYFVAGSSLGYFVLIFSLLASFMSAFGMFGMASLGYRTGFGSLFVLSVNLVPLGFLWYFIHRKTFLLGKARKWQSMGAPFGERYGRSMQILIPLVTIMASIPYLVAQIQGIGLMLEAMSDGLVPYKAGIFFIPVFIAIYLMMGGMKGTAWANTIQGIFFCVMGFVLFFTVMTKYGGIMGALDQVFALHPELFELGQKGGKVWSYPMIFGFSTAMCLGCVCFPQPYMHAYSSRTAKGFKAMVISFGGICMLLVFCAVMVGIVSTVLIPGLSGVEADKVYGLAASKLLPNALAALVVTGGFTAAMSTVNGMVFGNATNFANDIYKLMRPNAESRDLVKVARWSVLAILGISTLIAVNPKTPVAELSVIAFGIIAVTIFPLWGAYFWKGSSSWGAILSTIVGVGLNIAFFFIGGKNMILMPSASFFQLNGFLVALLAAGVVFFVVSILTGPGKQEIESQALFFHEALEQGAGRIGTTVYPGVESAAYMKSSSQEG